MSKGSASAVTGKLALDQPRHHRPTCRVTESMEGKVEWGSSDKACATVRRIVRMRQQ